MNTAEILKIHNAWRRGDDTRTQDELGFSVTDIGRAIDDAVRAIAERDKLRAELAQERERAVSARAGGEPEGVRSLLVECERALCCPDPAQRQVTASKVLRVLTAAPTAPAAKPEPIDDESPKRRIGELGNMLHNLSCELQDNHELADRVSTLACEAWDLGKELSPTAPAAKVPDEVYRLIDNAQALVAFRGHASYSDSYFGERKGQLKERLNDLNQAVNVLLVALSAAPQPAEQQPAPDVARLVEALESAKNLIANHSGETLPVKYAGDQIEQIDSALSAYRKGDQP